MIRLLTILLLLPTAGGDEKGNSDLPYPPSPVIERIEWDTSTVRTFGKGSDQWPMTWADDGDVYAAWGDGWGWRREPDEPKRSIGVTRLTGTPPNLDGRDLWGDGPGSGFGKPEALIAFDRSLFMFWTRGDSKHDQDDSFPATSTDGGRTWALGDSRAFPGLPHGFRVRGICQFGRGYQGNTDGFVYVYLGFSRADDLYLARVPRSNLFEPDRYEWFTALTGDGSARWSADHERKRPVFTDPEGSFWHVGVCHDSGIERYLLTKPRYGPGDDRARTDAPGSGIAGLGVFDAPAPWGPWTTVACTDPFLDDHVKFNYVIPTKFLGDDGRTLWMAWSGWPEYDSVSFIRGRIVPVAGGGRERE